MMDSAFTVETIRQVIATLDREIEARRLAREGLEKALAILDSELTSARAEIAAPLIKPARAVRSTPKQPARQGNIQGRVLEALAQGPMPRDGIGAVTGIIGQDLWNALSRLKGRGEVERMDDGRWRAIGAAASAKPAALAPKPPRTSPATSTAAMKWSDALGKMVMVGADGAEIEPYSNGRKEPVLRLQHDGLR